MGLDSRTALFKDPLEITIQAGQGFWALENTYPAPRQEILRSPACKPSRQREPNLPQQPDEIPF